MLTLFEYMMATPTTELYSHLGIMKDGKEIGSMCGPMKNHNDVTTWGNPGLMDLEVSDIYINYDFSDGENELVIEVDGNNLVPYWELKNEAAIYQADLCIENVRELASLEPIDLLKYIRREKVMFDKDNGCAVLMEY